MDTQKKTPIARERDTAVVQAKRAAFVATQLSLDPSRLIFVDESGLRLGSPPRYGWAPRGEDAPGKTVCGAWQTITMLGAIALSGFRGLMTIDAGTSTDVFLAFVQQVLAPNLRSGDIVVMDSLASERLAVDQRAEGDAVQSRGDDHRAGDQCDDGNCVRFFSSPPSGRPRPD